MVGISSCILVKEYNCLCGYNERVNGFNEYSKNKKRNANTKVKKRIYHLQDEDNNEMVRIKKEVITFQKENQYGISSMH